MADSTLLNPLRLTFFMLVAGVLTPLMAVERQVQKIFPVGPGATLKLTTYRGSIVVEESDEAEIRADIKVELATEDEVAADRILKNLDLELSADGDIVTVRARNPSESRARFTWTDQRLDLGFRIRIPRSCNLELTTIDGDITVGSVTGNVTAHARNGTISCRQINGRALIALEIGEIVVSRCTGDTDLSVTRGNIRAGTILGPAKLRNSSGDVEIQSASAGVTATTAAGDITAGFPRQFAGASNLKADGGSIIVKIHPAAHCDVHASSIWGQVRTTLPFTFEPGGNSKRLLIGKLNGGGPILTLRASGGNVRLEPSTQFID